MNNITLKIHHGTGQQTGTSLCRSCRYAQIMIDTRGEQIRCMLSDKIRVRGSVYECNQYYSKSLPSMDDLYHSAWTLKTEKDGRRIGFSPPDDERVRRSPAPVGG